MPHLSLKAAAEATGKNKATIFRSIQAGRLSAQRDAFGQWIIDPSELFRVYDPVAENATEAQRDVGDTQRYDATKRNDVDEEPCEVEIRLLRELLGACERLAEERSHRISNLETTNEGLENVISDLMARLDQESADRRRAYAQLTNLLTDQRTLMEKVSKAPVRRWWAWWK
ncbi:conserved hypothetical protein [Gammaproteobacteria bacterium]